MHHGWPVLFGGLQRRSLRLTAGSGLVFEDAGGPYVVGRRAWERDGGRFSEPAETRAIARIPMNPPMTRPIKMPAMKMT